MFLTAIALGFCSALGVFITLLRCPRTQTLHLLGHAWILDIACTALMFAMHWGTAIGGFSAVIAGLFCSLGITLSKSSLGYIKKGVYYKGWFGDARPVAMRNQTTLDGGSPL